MLGCVVAAPLQARPALAPTRDSFELFDLSFLALVAPAVGWAVCTQPEPAVHSFWGARFGDWQSEWYGCGAGATFPPLSA